MRSDLSRAVRSAAQVFAERVGTRLEKMYFLMLALIYGAVFVIAAAAPPNTLDSLAYHLVRVAHWIQAGSVNYYPTAILRQLYQNPLAEYAILQLHLLSGGDYYANLVQFFAFVACGALVFAVYFFGRAPKAAKVGFACRTLFVVLLALALNAGHFARNYQLFGSPLSTGEDKVANQKLSAPVLFSNLVRNYALHLEISTDRAPGFLEHVAESLVGAEELNNPDSTYLNLPFNAAYSQHEDLAGNLIHIFLLTACLFAIFFYRGEKRNLVLMSGVCTVAGFVLFCAVLRWQPWASRLHLPLFIFGCTFVSVMLARVTARMAVLIPALCFVGALPVLFLGKPRPLISNDRLESVLTAPRRQQYLVNLPDLYVDFLVVSNGEVQSGRSNPEYRRFSRNLPNLPADTDEAKAFLKNAGAEEVGLMLAVDYKNLKFAEWEYLIWLGLKDDFAERPLIRHVGVDNISARLNAGQPPPEFVITNDDEDKLIEGIRYETAWRGTVLRILRWAE